MFKRLICIILGCISLLLGAVGVILPILPTTPFVLLSAILFSWSNPALARRLERNRVFGPYILHYRTKRGVPASIKRQGLAWLWGSLTLSAVIARDGKVTAILGFVGICVSIHILLLKSYSPPAAFGKQYQCTNTTDHQ